MAGNEFARAVELQNVRDATVELERVQAEAQAAVARAGRERSRAVRAALEVFSAIDLARELGVSRARIYQLRDGV